MGNREKPRPAHYDLEVWQEAMRLARDVYRASADFPTDERYGLTSQVRRSAVSIPSNIAEGAGRGSRAEYCRFLLIARGSLMELDTQLWIAKDLGLVADDEAIREQIFRLAARMNRLIATKR